MNVRKAIDYDSMFKALDTLASKALPQMELYCEIGRVVSIRPEKGTTVAATEYLCCAYPNSSGFSHETCGGCGSYTTSMQKLPISWLRL